ncbi:hypothetical protein BH09ACT12_BH09ACT12_26530 [soil metagenome]
MSSPGQPLHPALAGQPGHLLWRAHARVAATTEEEQRAGVDPHAVAVLVALPEHGASQQELADTVGISRTTMVRVAAALVTQGLVQRERNAADRRSYTLTRTEAGSRTVVAWQERAEAVQDSLAATLTSCERGELISLLARVARPEIAPDAPAPLREHLGFLIGRAHSHLHRQVLAALEPLDLEPRLLGTLTLLTATGPITQSELARLLGLSGASVVQIADDLESRGVVERRRDPTDRRTQQLHLRPGAEDTIATAHAVANGCIGEQLADLSADDVARLVELLNRFVTAPASDS